MGDASTNQPKNPDDKVGGLMSQALAGRTFKYAYPSGIQYTISFDETHVFFTNPKLRASVHSQDTPFISLPYRARQLRPNLLLAHWMTPARAGHVTLVYDLDEGTVNCAALMPGKFELFDTAVVEGMWVNGENAVWKME